MKIVMPDPLSWKAGHEYGLQALKNLKEKNIRFSCVINQEGPLLEAVAFAVFQLNLSPDIRFSIINPEKVYPADVAVFPRVHAGPEKPVRRYLDNRVLVVSSDPAVRTGSRTHVFPRRDWRALANKLEAIWSAEYKNPK